MSIELHGPTCIFLDVCKRAEVGNCNKPCYPYTVMYGNSGQGGYISTTGLPKKYMNCFKHNLPVMPQNTDARKMILLYIDNILRYAKEKALGLFLFSIPSKENLFGTGTGKTTTACTLLNEYLKARVKEALEQQELTNNPVYFVRLAEFQTIYNSRFSGIVTQYKSDIYQRMKNRMKSAEFLVIDDIATRGSTEAFNNELYDIIDYRAVEEKTTIFTANIALKDLTDIYGERITSRIAGMTVEIGLGGKDYRRREL